MVKATYFVGVDVGTGSTRAALVTSDGKILRTAVENITTYSPKNDFYEQSSEEIWNACVKCIKEVVAGVKPEEIKGLGFDATCSLVALDKNEEPISISPNGDNNQNIILWMDHRASKEAQEINILNHSVLRYVGGKISLEMETPKLLWLKRNLPEHWKQYSFFFDLPDFLTYKATNTKSRSLCSLVCKWTYEISEEKQGWNGDYFEKIGLGDLQNDNWEKIGQVVLQPGCPVGNGLSASAAKELGLHLGTPVGTSLIDAHAGGLGLIGCRVPGIDSNFNTRLGLICGTSTCHMAVSKTPIFAQGIWGPYFSAMVPEMWLNEGGQSATGKLLDHVIETHPAFGEIKRKIGELHVQTYLSQLLKQMSDRAGFEDVCFLTRDLHVWPDFHGNRSPLADPTLKGAIFGLTLSQDEENLALIYLATVQALTYGTRHILDSLGNSGHQISTILICGGLTKNSLFIQTQADVANLPVVCPKEPESVLLGAAILGAQAARFFPDMNEAMKSMGGEGVAVKPNVKVLEYHQRKYKVFLKMYENQMEYRKIMGA